ncbi:MAG: TlpA family protein disulfide reductase, partial [Bacteroidia bacterium]
NLFLKNDPLLKNDTLRELVIIRNLWDYYFSPQFDMRQVVDVVEQFRQETKIAAHKKIAENILTIAYKLQPGGKAPGFTATDKGGKEISLSDYKNKYVYLNFFNTKSVNSLNEMPKVMDLVKKYGDKVVFISICTDDSLKAYADYVRANPKYTWSVLYNGVGRTGTAKEAYNVRGVPACFFISNYGTLLQSPAQAPTQGFEFKLKALFKPKRNGNKIGIR